MRQSLPIASSEMLVKGVTSSEVVASASVGARRLGSPRSTSAPSAVRLVSSTTDESILSSPLSTR